MYPDGFSISIKFDKSQYKAADQQLLKFNLTNVSDSSVRILKWNTPFEGFNSNMFRVEKAGKPVAYLGRTIKRGVPTREDFMTLEPRELVSVESNIAEFYDISETGDYRVEFRPTLLGYGRKEPTMEKAIKPDFTSKLVRSNKVTFRLLEKREPRQLKGVALEMIEDFEEMPKKKVPPNFTNCSQNEQKSLNKALTEAEKIASKSKFDLGTPKDERLMAARFRTLFGNFDDGINQYLDRWTKVTLNFDKIWDVLANKKITFESDHSENAYAYVYPSKPYKIYLGNSFWSAPLNGTDSQAGTLVHEISHFYVVAGTDDHAYSQNGCKQLAIKKPSNAIDNADSHEYFAENNPPLANGVSKALYAYILASTHKHL